MTARWRPADEVLEQDDDHAPSAAEHRAMCGLPPDDQPAEPCGCAACVAWRAERDSSYRPA